MTTKKPYRNWAVMVMAFLLLLATGCSVIPDLPAIAADELHYRRTDPAGGTEINARGVQVDDETVRADEATWNTTYPAFSVTVRAKGYKRQLKPEEKPKPLSPD